MSTGELRSTVNRALLRAQLEADAWADAASNALGVNRTDFACLRALHIEGSCTAGRLAEATGLTTGAITGVIDRLEKAGYVVRTADPDDRRKVIVQVAGERVTALELIMAGVATGQAPADVERFLDEQAQTLRRETERLRAGNAASTVEGGPSGDISIPLRGLESATLEVVGGAMNLEIVVAGVPGELLRADLSGPRLRISEQDGRVRVAHRAFGFGRPTGRITLNSGVAWSFRIGGGNNHLTFALEGARVRAIDVDGGAGDLAFRMGSPESLVPIRVNGGASNVRVVRAKDVPMEVALTRAGASRLEADGEDLGAASTRTWASHRGAEALIRVAVKGGMNRISVAEA